MGATDLVWYVAYGSNTEVSGISHYLETTGGSRADAHLEHNSERLSQKSAWVDIPHSLYFAGYSKTWDSSVAFVSLTQTKRTIPARGRAYLVTLEELHTIAAKENGYPRIPDLPSVTLIPEGTWAPLPVSLDSEGAKGKYNALLRLPNLLGRQPLVTLTTSRTLEMAVPVARYLSRVRSGLSQDPSDLDVAIRIKSALGHTGLNSQFVDVEPSLPIRWSGSILATSKSYGFPSVTLPALFNGASTALDIAQGHVIFEHQRIDIWVLFRDVPHAEFSPEARHMLRLDTPEPLVNPTPFVIELNEVRILQHASTIALDLPDSDVVQVAAAEASRLGRWALLINTGVAGPVRIEPRTYVQSDEVRVAYATRTLLSQARGQKVHLQAIQSPPNKWKYFIERPLVSLGELFFGAPTLALRATEALIGDEGRPVIRVDPGALDFIGVEPGDTIVVTWAHRRVKARVLLQSDLTRGRMEEQLMEKTGQQTRVGFQTNAVESRLSVPPHLRAWMSPTLRYALGVPADTVVRIRRSIAHLLLKSTARLALSIVALIIGGFAIPDVDRVLWLVVSLVVIALTLAPSRLGHVSGKEPRRSRPRSRMNRKFRHGR